MSGTAVIQSLRPETLTWDQALSMFRLRGRAGGHSPHTAENYHWTFDAALGFFRGLGIDRPAAVTPVHVHCFLDDCRLRGLASSTIETRYRHLRTFFRSLAADELLEKDPTDRVQRPKIEAKQPKAFKPQDFLAILGKIDTKKALGKRDMALYCLLFDSGARLSEILGLQIQHLDLSGSVAGIRGKGGRYRQITWGERTGKAMLDWLRCRSKAKPEDWVFCDLYGKQLTRNAVRLRLKRLTRRAGIAVPRLGAHAMRHGCAVALLRGGADLETVRRVLGHTRLTTTQVYLQGLTNEDALAKARTVGVVDRLESVPGLRRRVVAG